MTQVQPVSFRQKILSKEIKRAHAMQVVYEDLHVEPGFNLRTPIERLGGKLREKAEAAEESLFRHIMAGGQYPALEVRPRAEGGVWIVDGHRRHRNIGRAIAAGAPLQNKDGIVLIDVVAFEGNDAERTERVISSAQGQGLFIVDTAFGYRVRLQTSGRYTEATIRKSPGYYNSGCSNIAVPCHVVDAIAADGDPKEFDSPLPDDATPSVVMNTRANWKTLIANVIAAPQYPCGLNSLAPPERRTARENIPRRSNDRLPRTQFPLVPCRGPAPA